MNNGWLPIESAPKDGTCILVWGPEEEGFNSGMGVVWFCALEGWFVEGDLGSVGESYTHWQPLPAPPSS